VNRFILRAFAVSALLLMTAWAAAGAFASGRGHQTVVPTPHRFTTAPFKGVSAPRAPGAPSIVGRNFRAITKSGAQSETTIAVDPTNSNHMLAASNDLSNFSSYNNVVESFDRGRTWVSAGLTVNTFCYDPWLTFNAVGDAFFAYECSDQRVAYRKVGQANWTHTTLQNSSLFPDRDMIVADRNPASPFFGSIYIGYDEANVNNAAHVWYSRDGFSGWVKSPKINDTSSTIGVNASTGPDGTVYAVWEDFNGKKIWVDKSTNGGATWSTDHIVTNYRLATQSFFVCLPPQPDRCQVPMPFSAVDNSGGAFDGRLYVTYSDKDPAASDWNTYVRYSDDGGTTWSAEIEVNDDTGGYQFHPRIAVAPNGTVGVAFYDTRDDNTLDEKTHTYISFSTNGGVTWTANERVTTGQSDESGAGDPNDYGDYQGIDTSSTSFFQVVWTDSRPGTMAEDVLNASAKL
jgi:hypothetical protein